MIFLHNASGVSMVISSAVTPPSFRAWAIGIMVSTDAPRMTATTARFFISSSPIFKTPLFS
jgi:hypothetical protein